MSAHKGSKSHLTGQIQSHFCLNVFSKNVDKCKLNSKQNKQNKLVHRRQTLIISSSNLENILMSGKNFLVKQICK